MIETFKNTWNQSWILVHLSLKRKVLVEVFDDLMSLLQRDWRTCKLFWIKASAKIMTLNAFQVQVSYFYSLLVDFSLHLNINRFFLQSHLVLNKFFFFVFSSVSADLWIAFDVWWINLLWNVLLYSFLKTNATLIFWI